MVKQERSQRGDGGIIDYVQPASGKPRSLLFHGDRDQRPAPRELEASGYAPGASVLVEAPADGELRILPAEMVRERVRQIAARTASELSGALQILADHDAEHDASK